MIRSVNILIRDEAGRTLLQMRDGAARIAPLRWGFWGGRLEPGDADPRHGAARELAEELAVEAAADAFEPLDTRTGGDGQVAFLVRLRRPLGWPDITVREGAGAGFFWRRDLAGLPVAGSVAWYFEHRPELFAESPADAAQAG